MIGTAFPEGETSREGLLARLENPDEAAQLWLAYAGEAECVAAGTEYGFHPAFILLVDALTQFGDMDNRRAFVTAVVRALPPKADTASIVRTWLLLTWKEDLSEILADSPATDHAMGIVGLLQASLNAEVPPKAWRTARSALARVNGLAPDVADGAQVLLTMAWDLDKTPGAASDVVPASLESAMQAANRAKEWTVELGERLDTIMTTIRDRATEAVREQFGQLTAQTDKATQERAIQTFRDENERQLSEWPGAVELSLHREECRKLGGEKFERWLEVARSRLMSALTPSHS